MYNKNEGDWGMKIFVKPIIWLTISALFVPTWLIPKISAQESPQIIINELAWAGSSVSSQDEWIELFNPTTETIDIGGWQLTKNTAEEKLMLIIPESSAINAGDYFLISNFDETDSVIAIEPSLIDSAVTLSNSALQIKLYSGDFEKHRPIRATPQT